jgi:hypothetical protein
MLSICTYPFTGGGEETRFRLLVVPMLQDASHSLSP